MYSIGVNLNGIFYEISKAIEWKDDLKMKTSNNYN